MAINFPSSPTINDTYTYLDRTWKWNGKGWALQSTANYATGQQGAKADTALQPADIGSSVQGYNANTVIDASYVHTDNNYTTTEKNKLSGIASGAEVNVNADWNSVSGDSQILNKPTLATVATTGSYTDLINKPTITNGTVTSIGLTVPTGLSVTGAPVTTSGTIAIELTSGYSIPTTGSQTNWDTAYTDRNKWDGGSGNLVASTGRTSLGATTVGSNLFTLANPSSISFPRINADNTVSTLDAASFRTAIGAGTSSTTGTVTSITGTGTVSGLSLSGTVTTSGNITLSGTLSVTPSNFSSQTANTILAAPNGSAGTPTFRALVAADIPTLNQNTTGTASNVTGTVAIVNGGTGATTASAGRVNLLPSLTGNAGKVLAVNSATTDVEWVTPATGSGTVTSVGLTVPSGLSVSGSPVTGSGTLAISTSLNGIVKGTGSGLTTATAGTDYILPSGSITTIAVVSSLPASPSANTLYIVTG